MISSNNNGFKLCKCLNRNRILSILAGVFFAIGWWIIIDMICQYPTQTDFNKIYLIIGIIATLALILSNCVSNSQVRGYDDGNNSLGQIGARFILFISFLLVFGSFIASTWILFGYYITYKKERFYPGLAIFLQNLAILISTLILKLGRKENLLFSKTYEKFWCATEEGYHQLSCSDETALLTDITIIKVYRRGQMCEPDVHSEYLIHCQSYVDGSLCEGNKTCSIAISSRDYIQCEDKIYTPTYFFVKYTCTQIHTMCIDTEPIRNTLHGYIISPAYPHPMADNLKCSITIEADPSMYIELSPIQIHLQEAIKCRGEYIEIFGYDPSLNENNINKNNNWKEYHTWCGADRSINNPLSNTRYLISSNSLYMSLQTTVSRDPRYFKIRYRVVPVIARSQYNSDGIIHDPLIKESRSSLMILTTSIMLTKTMNSLLNNSHMKNVNETLTKQTFKKEILIGILIVVIVLLIATVASILIFILIKRRRSSFSSSSSTKKKNIPSTTNNTTSKSTVKSSDKAPLLDKINNTSTNVTKQKLVPERTVQISDVSTSRFKSPELTSTKSGLTKSEVPSSKPTLTAVDSGIYGVDLTEDSIATVSKPVSSSTIDPSKIQNNILLETSESVSTVVVNPLSDNSTMSPAIIFSNDIIERNPLLTNENEEKETLLDHTVQSAYPHLVDIASSESDATLCGSGPQSRRSSITKQPLIIQDSNNIETIVLSDDNTQLSSYHPIPFNPLHVILQKDANKYYTTEYI